MSVGLRSVLVVVFALLAPLAWAQDSQPHCTTVPDDPIQARICTLANGFTVLLSENHELPQVRGAVVVKTGAKREEKTATGVAHYLEHMLFKGTTELGSVDFAAEKPHLDRIEALYDKLQTTEDAAERERIQKQINEQSLAAAQYTVPNEFDRLLSTIGATGVNAGTGQDQTFYYSTVPSTQLERWLTVYGHIFAQPVFRLFQSELETVYEEKNLYMDNFGAQLIETLTRTFYGEHPYGRPILGSIDHLKRPNLRAMRAFFETFYVANNMGLVLVGDFDADAVLPQIARAFGGLRQGAVPAYQPPPIKRIEGRQQQTVAMTPLPLGVLAFPTTPRSDPDHPVFEYLQLLLSNKAQSGLIDELSRDRRMMGAYAIFDSNDELGMGIVLLLPTPILQSVEGAEREAVERLQRIGRGEVTEQQIAAVRFNLLTDLQLRWESNDGRAMALGECFSRGRAWSDCLAETRQLEQVTRADVVRVAKKYLGTDYLLLKSDIGFPAKTRLDKPPIAPVVAKASGPSPFFRAVQALSTLPAVLRSVDFTVDTPTRTLQPGVTLTSTGNPYNDVYTLQIAFGVGTHQLRALNALAQYLSSVGTRERKTAAFKAALFDLATSLNFWATPEELVVELSGPDRNLGPALALVGEMMRGPAADPKQLQQLVDAAKANRDANLREPSMIGDLLRDYAWYGRNAEALRLPGPRALARLDVDGLLRSWQMAQQYEVKLRYTGRLDPAQVGDLARRQLPLRAQLKPAQSKVVYPPIAYPRSTLLLVKNSELVQSQIWFSVATAPINADREPLARAFNEYIGGMSGLVFQEVRELRSLAYATGGHLRVAPIPDRPGQLNVFVGTQSDKTREALDVVTGLFKQLPQKPERMAALKASLDLSLAAAQPGFRERIRQVEDWQRRGYRSDPRPVWRAAIERMSFADIDAFYRSQIAGRPIVISFVADPKRLEPEALKAYGDVIEVDPETLFAR